MVGRRAKEDRWDVYVELFCDVVKKVGRKRPQRGKQRLLAGWIICYLATYGYCFGASIFCRMLIDFRFAIIWPGNTERNFTSSADLICTQTQLSFINQC